MLIYKLLEQQLSNGPFPKNGKTQKYLQFQVKLLTIRG